MLDVDFLCYIASCALKYMLYFSYQIDLCIASLRAVNWPQVMTWPLQGFCPTYQYNAPLWVSKTYWMSSSVLHISWIERCKNLSIENMSPECFWCGSKYAPITDDVSVVLQNVLHYVSYFPIHTKALLFDSFSPHSSALSSTFLP